MSVQDASNESDGTHRLSKAGVKWVVALHIAMSGPMTTAVLVTITAEY